MWIDTCASSATSSGVIRSRLSTVGTFPLSNDPQLDNRLILDHVAVALAERHLRAAQQQIAADLVGLALSLASEDEARTAAGIERYFRDVRAAIDAGATTGEQVRAHVRQARERAAG